MHQISVIVSAKERESFGISDSQMVDLVLKSAVWKKFGSLTGKPALQKKFNNRQDAKCSKCCPDGGRIVTLGFRSLKKRCCNKFGAFEIEDVFCFTAKPRCSSTRAHHGSKIVLVVTGIPFLSKPLVSAPISLHARGKKSKIAPETPSSVYISCKSEDSIVSTGTVTTEQALVPYGATSHSSMDKEVSDIVTASINWKPTFTPPSLPMVNSARHFCSVPPGILAMASGFFSEPTSRFALADECICSLYLVLVFLTLQDQLLWLQLCLLSILSYLIAYLLFQ